MTPLPLTQQPFCCPPARVPIPSLILFVFSGDPRATDCPGVLLARRSWFSRLGQSPDSAPLARPQPGCPLCGWPLEHP